MTRPLLVLVLLAGCCRCPSTAPAPPAPPAPAPAPLPPPAPIPAAGLHVLFVYESADLSKMPAAQQNVLYARSVRDYLNATCPLGPDGKTREWRMWDKDVNPAGESKLWQDAFARPRASVPWAVVSDGKAGFEGPLPGTVDDALKLLKQYGGP